jgi:hypothetical protein
MYNFRTRSLLYGNFKALIGGIEMALGSVVIAPFSLLFSFKEQFPKHLF